MLKKAEVQSNTNRYFDSIRCPNAAFSGVIDQGLIPSQKVRFTCQLIEKILG